MATQKDNSTFASKLRLRRALLHGLDAPVVLETHGGFGKLYELLYRSASAGAVVEKDYARCKVLATQRPTWAVYQGDAAQMLAAGAGNHLAVNVLDVDPYGDPWPVLRAFFASTRPRVSELRIAVNDGLRQGIRLGRAWGTESLKGAVKEFGNDLGGSYLAVCRWMLERLAAPGYSVTRFTGRYCGKAQGMTHYAAWLTAATPATPGA